MVVPKPLSVPLAGRDISVEAEVEADDVDLAAPQLLLLSPVQGLANIPSRHHLNNMFSLIWKLFFLSFDIYY